MMFSLLKTVFGILRPRTGTVSLLGEDITGLKSDRIVRKGISYVPQLNNVFPSLTVEENLEMGAFIRGDDFSSHFKEPFAAQPGTVEARVFTVLGPVPENAEVRIFNS